MESSGSNVAIRFSFLSEVISGWTPRHLPRTAHAQILVVGFRAFRTRHWLMIAFRKKVPILLHTVQQAPRELPRMSLMNARGGGRYARRALPRRRPPPPPPPPPQCRRLAPRGGARQASTAHAAARSRGWRYPRRQRRQGGRGRPLRSGLSRTRVSRGRRPLCRLACRPPPWALTAARRRRTPAVGGAAERRRRGSARRSMDAGGGRGWWGASCCPGASGPMGKNSG